MSDETETTHLVRPADGLAVASLVLGILACMSFWIFPVCAIFGAVAFVLGRVAQRRYDTMPSEHKSRMGRNARGWATAGIVLAVSGIFLSGALLGSCYCMVQDAAKQGQLEYSKEIRDLENDPELRKQLDELRKDLKQLDEQRPDAEKKKDAVKDKSAGEE
jgi:hypothetical protein